MNRQRVVIVGGGLAAQRCAAGLRRNDYAGRVTIVGGEPHTPYDRPPLSKELLGGEIEADTLSFRAPAWYADHDVELILGRAACGLDARAGRVELDDGELVAYDHLVIATGSAPRMIPVLGDHANVHVLRTRDDAERLRDALRPGTRLAIVGAGFIGLEVAATARARGVQTTLVEALDVPLAGALGPDLGRWIAGLHRDHGVDIRVGARLEGVRADGDGRIEQLVLAGDQAVECDVVLVAVGVAPATDWLAGSGLPPGGIQVDRAGRSTLPGVYAAGDAALVFDPALGRHVRCEHWESAARQGLAVAHTILGRPVPEAPPAAFWSDQFGVRMHFIGHGAGAERIEIDGDPEAADFTATLIARGRPIGVLLVGRTHELAATRRLIAGTHPQREGAIR